MKPKHILLFIFIFVLLAGCSYLSYLKDPFTDIPAFSKVTEDIYRGGYPKPRAYARLKNMGVKTIINLSNGSNSRFDIEQQMVRKYGFNFVHIPLSVYTSPEDEKVLLFLLTVLSPESKPVFVHCTSGRDRTGAMIAVYRTIVEGKSPKASYKEALRHGFWPYKGEVILKKYIHQLKDKKIFYEFVRTYQENLTNNE